MPNYRFNPVDLAKNRIMNPNGYRNVVSSFLTEMNTLLGNLAECLNEDNLTGALDELMRLQQTSIELGEYTEDVKGEGYDIVSVLEQFCEDIYGLYEPLNEYLTENEENDSSVIWDEALVEQAYTCVDQKFAELVDLYDRRKESAFFCLKPDFFKDYRGLYEEAKADPDCDVYVIPIPWFKRNIDGSVKEYFYSLEGYPEDVDVYDCQKYDAAVHEPEITVIQYAQDEYGDRMGMPSVYHSLNLRKYTDKLILIPYEEPDDFEESEFRPYYNMKFYATMPGVMCADEVWLYSEKLRGLYVKKLVEFSGEEYGGLWEEKIKVVDWPNDRKFEPAVSEIRKTWDSFRNTLGSGWTGHVQDELGEIPKKLILYQPVFSSFVEYGERMLEKLERNLKIFKDSSDSIVLIWLEQRPLKQDLVKIDEKVAAEYRKLVDEFIQEGYGVFISDFVSDNEYKLPSFVTFLENEGIRKGATLERIAIEICDAYYGDGDYVARQFTLEKKPVMIQNVEI